MAKKQSTTEESGELTQVLPPVEDGELARIDSIELLEKKTRPPKRYTEGALVKDMKDAGKFLTESNLRKVLRDSSGLGTSATRDSIIEALKERQFIERQGQNLVSTKKGRDLIAYLPPEFADVALTARWEGELDVVAQRGGGPALEARIRDEVSRLVGILKAHGPMTRSEAVTRTSPSGTGTGGGAKRKSSPTDKMLAYARSIAERAGVKIPTGVKDDFEACREFIEKHKGAAASAPTGSQSSGSTSAGGAVLAPSPKQLEYAKSIAKKKNLTIPDKALKNMKELSAWIDANR